MHHSSTINSDIIAISSNCSTQL